MFDQAVEADITPDIQKYAEDLINDGLRQRLITIIKVSISVFLFFCPSPRVPFECFFTSFSLAVFHLDCILLLR